MKKKLTKVLAATLVAVTALTGCGSAGSENASGATSNVKIGMVTDMGSIDDRSFNQLTWEGIQKAGKDFGVKSKYLKPTGTTEPELMKELGNLYDGGFNFIVGSGYKFATPMYEAQTKYPNAKFVITDSTIYSASGDVKVADNSVAVVFKGQEAGFLAGVAAAVQLKEANAGFIGGMESDVIQSFNWGYQQGIAYANENLGTNIKVEDKNFIYQGTFTDSAAGQQLAAQMYDRGVDVIFSAAGGVGAGVIKEARERAAAGQKVWVIGVDADQYNDGIYEGQNSVVLTSALKNVGVAVYDTIKLDVEGNFPGGQTLEYGLANNGVGLPSENPNLSEETINAINTVYEKVQNGEIKISATGEGLIA
ncbi:BMP family lipoprotein [Cellulosilyticum ruminicola]|uniref:BMP family lipoprotein n=1 Tax=Cellulosilyticum ruminicola TaxID=425254 RepID=UPI0006CFE33F|nr:BMP family ABC transporter substrate-binding protein [Cellulosilyticum ruminicola]